MLTVLMQRIAPTLYPQATRNPECTPSDAACLLSWLILALVVSWWQGVAMRLVPIFFRKRASRLSLPCYWHIRDWFRSTDISIDRSIDRLIDWFHPVEKRLLTSRASDDEREKTSIIRFWNKNRDSSPLHWYWISIKIAHCYFKEFLDPILW